VLFLFLAGTMGSGVVTPPTPPVFAPPAGGGRNTAGGAGHYDLPEKTKELINRLTKEDAPTVTLEVIDGKLTAKSDDFTADELEMIAFLLSEL
jgi:hypothetical protein